MIRHKVVSQTTLSSINLGFIASSEENTKYMYHGGIDIAIKLIRQKQIINEQIPIR